MPTPAASFPRDTLQEELHHFRRLPPSPDVWRLRKMAQNGVFSTLS